MVSGADQQHRLIGGEMLLSREYDGVAMSAVTATGMLLRIRRNAATASSLPKGACYLMSAVDAWFIGTTQERATPAGADRDDLR
jgi:hypothetical protein